MISTAFRIPIPSTAGSWGVARERMAGKESGVTGKDWFFYTKNLTKEKVMEAFKK